MDGSREGIVQFQLNPKHVRQLGGQRTFKESFVERKLTPYVGEDIPVAEALAVLQVRALNLEPEITAQV